MAPEPSTAAGMRNEATYVSTESAADAPIAASGAAPDGKAIGNVMGAPPVPQSAPAAPPTETPIKAPPGDSAVDHSNKQYLVYTATFHMAVYQVEAGLDRAEALAKELGGYLAARGDQEITIRVPRAKFNEALDRVAQSGEVLHRDVKALDVTDEFVDTESRLKNARVMRDRLQALLAKAAVKEAIEIEKELGRVTGEIEVLEGKLKLLSDRIAFSTITVRYAGRGNSGQLRINLPFEWVRSLGVHRLLNLQVLPE